MANTREQRRQMRVVLDKPLPVELGSIGSEIRYNLTTRNLSNSGFFLEFARPGRFPFSTSSIMEIWLKLSPEITIFFNGKMVRAVYSIDEEAKETGPGIAIRIIQIDPDQQTILTDFLSAQLAERNQSPEEINLETDQDDIAS